MRSPPAEISIVSQRITRVVGFRPAVALNHFDKYCPRHLYTRMLASVRIVLATESLPVIMGFGRCLQIILLSETEIQKSQKLHFFRIGYMQPFPGSAGQPSPTRPGIFFNCSARRLFETAVFSPP